MSITAPKTSLISLALFTAVVAQYAKDKVKLPGMEVEVPKEDLLTKLAVILLIYMISYVVLWVSDQAADAQSIFNNDKLMRRHWKRLWIRQKPLTKIRVGVDAIGTFESEFINDVDALRSGGLIGESKRNDLIGEYRQLRSETWFFGFTLLWGRSVLVPIRMFVFDVVFPVFVCIYAFFTMLIAQSENLMFMGPIFVISFSVAAYVTYHLAKN